MSFEIYVDCVGETKRRGIAVDDAAKLFPVVKAKSQPDYWHIFYGDRNFCDIGLTLHSSDDGMLTHLSVFRPCADRRLYEGLFEILRMGSVVAYWPDGPPVVASSSTVADLDPEMIEALGQPKILDSAEDLVGMFKRWGA